MRILLDPEDDSGGQIVVNAGEVCRIGRSAPSEFMYSDELLSSQHFAIDCRGPECRVHDLNSRNGTFLNGSRITEAILADGNLISAGRAKFRVRMEDGRIASSTLPVLDPSQLKEPQKQLLTSLVNFPEPLFALLDAARDDRVLDLLRSSGEKYQSLYEGKQGRDLDAWAPYLVELSKDSQLLLSLLHEGWDKSWGVFLTCSSPFADVRKHFRHFLMVEGEGGQQLYFRFYDPRVLRVFVPRFTDAEADTFFGPVHCYLVEGEKPGTIISLRRH